MKKLFFTALFVLASALPGRAQLLGDEDLRFYAGKYDVDTFWYLPNTKTELFLPQIEGKVFGINMVQKLYTVEVPFTMFISCENNIYLSATPLFDGTIHWGKVYTIEHDIELEVKRFVCR